MKKSKAKADWHGMQRKLPAFIAIFMAFGIAVLLLTGCHHSGSVVGKWHGTWSNTAMQKTVYNVDTEYKPDGTATISEDSPFGHATAGMKYTVHGDTLTQHAYAATINNKAIPIAPGTVAPAEVYHFSSSGDTLTMKQVETGTEMTLTRVH